MSDAFKVEQDFNVAAQQFQVMQDSVKLIQDTSRGLCRLLGAGLDRAIWRGHQQPG